MCLRLQVLEESRVEEQMRSSKQRGQEIKKYEVLWLSKDPEFWESFGVEDRDSRNVGEVEVGWKRRMEERRAFN
jgi:hypothetical protein